MQISSPVPLKIPVLVPGEQRAASRERRATGGFTLIEIVIVMTILAVLAAASMPTFKGMMNERKTREPVAELSRLAKAARMRAMKEKRPYQVAISQQGFTASRYFDPYLNMAELTEFLTVSDQAEASGVPDKDDDSDPAAKSPDPASSGKVAENTTTLNGQAPIPKAEWNERYTLPPGTVVSGQFWHEATMMPLDGDSVKLWVFQPNGMCEPLKLQLSHQSASFEIEFSALTADIVREKSDIK